MRSLSCLPLLLSLLTLAALSGCSQDQAHAWSWLPSGTRAPFFRDTPIPSPGGTSIPPTAAQDTPGPASTPVPLRLELADPSGDGVSCQDGSVSAGDLSPLSDLVGATFTLAGPSPARRLELRLHFAQQGDYRQALVAENPFLFRAGLEVYTQGPALARDPDWLPNNLSQLGIHGDWNSATATLEGAVSRLDGTVWHTLQVDALEVHADEQGLVISLPGEMLSHDARLALSVLWWDAAAHAPVCDFLGLGSDYLPAIKLADQP